MRKKFNWEWEKLDEHTCRAKVIGGWIVHVQAVTNKGSLGITSCFVADMNHEWIILPPVEKKEERTPESYL